MKREIGGYLPFEELKGEPHYKDAIKLNTARNAMLYLAIARGIKKIHFPYFMCDSVRNAFAREKYNIEFVYYHINEDFTPILDNVHKEDFVYIVNYFGQISNEQISQYKSLYVNLIVDNTQAFYQQPVNGADTIYSIRKFFGIPDGAYLFTDAKIDCELEYDKSKDRFAHLFGRYEETASEFYVASKQNDKNLASLPLMKMSKLTENILNAVDYEKLFKLRTEIYEKLFEKFRDVNKLNLKKIEGAFAYPLYVENGMDLKSRLAKQGIYIPTLWPNVLEDCDVDSVEYKVASNILPLPVNKKCLIKYLDKKTTIGRI